MKIRCKLEREGGTVVNLEGVDYHFAPLGEGGPHVCEVARKDHFARLLAIPEAYEVYDPEEPVVAKPEAPKSEGAPKTATATDYNGLTRKQLVVAYRTKFKKNPSPRAKDATLVKALIGG